MVVVEVADSSLRFDTTTKLALYARSGVAEYWVVNLQHRVLDIHRQPSQAGYADVTRHTPADTVSLALAPEVSIRLARVFG